MKRRDFITSSTIATAGLGSVLVASCNTTDKPAKEATISAETIPDFELNEESVSSLQEKIVAGKYSSEQITKLYLDRIETIDKKGPMLNSVIEINPDAMIIASGFISITEFSIGPFLSIVSMRSRYNLVICSELYLPATIFSCNDETLSSFNSKSGIVSADIVASFAGLSV